MRRRMKFWLKRGLLSALLPECSNFWVNSLHGQGAKVVSPRLRVEARSPDGLVEAVSVINHPFALGVQWRRNGTVAVRAFAYIVRGLYHRLSAPYR